MFKANIGGGCVVSGRVAATHSVRPCRKVFGKRITAVLYREPSITVSKAGGSAVQGGGNSGRKVEPSVGGAVAPIKQAIHLLHLRKPSLATRGC